MLEWSEACDCLVWYESVVHSREQECNGEQGGQAMGSQCKKARQHFLLSFTSFGFYSWRPRFIVFETEDDLKRVKPIAWEKRGWEIVVTNKCIFCHIQWNGIWKYKFFRIRFPYNRCNLLSIRNLIFTTFLVLNSTPMILSPLLWFINFQLDFFISIPWKKNYFISVSDFCHVMGTEARAKNPYRYS